MRILSWTGLSLCLFFSFCQFTLAEITTRKIVILGDYMEYSTRSEDIIVKGSARAFNTDMNITAATLQANIEENRLFAYGDVVFWQKNEKNTGEFIFYDLRTGEGYLKKARVIRGDQIISAETLNFSPSYLEAENLSFTTCDNPSPDFEITSDRMFIKYGDHMIVENMKVIFQGKIIRQIPRQYSDLKETPKIIRQKFGYSRYNGVYGTFSFPYSIGENRSGSISSSHYMQRGGGFNFSENLKLYSSNTLNYSGSYFDDNKSMQKDGKIYLSWQGKIKNSSLSSRFSYSSLTDSNDQTNQELLINADASGSLTAFGKALSYSMHYNDRKDIDDDRYTGDNYYSLLKKIPELQVTLPSVSFKAMQANMNPVLTVAKYHQTGGNGFKGSKYSLRNSMNITPFRGGKNFPFSFRINEETLINYYSTSDLMKVSSLTLQLDQDFLKFKNSLRYSKRVVSGDSTPFRFDNESESENLFFSVDLNLNLISMKIFSTSYDFQNNRFGSAYSDLRVNAPSDSFHLWSLYLKTDYSLDGSDIWDLASADLKMTNIYSQFSIKPRDDFLRYGLNFSASYNAQTSKMRDFSGGMDFKLHPLTEKAHMAVNTRYDYSRAEFTSLNYDLNYDLHCFDSKFTYNTKDKDFWFEIFMKANPQKPTRILYDYDKKKLKPVLRNYDI